MNSFQLTGSESILECTANCHIPGHGSLMIYWGSRDWQTLAGQVVAEVTQRLSKCPRIRRLTVPHLFLIWTQYSFYSLGVLQRFKSIKIQVDTLTQRVMKMATEGSWQKTLPFSGTLSASTLRWKNVLVNIPSFLSYWMSVVYDGLSERTSHTQS